jgi:hypothetical protein
MKNTLKNNRNRTPKYIRSIPVDFSWVDYGGLSFSIFNLIPFLTIHI